MSEHIVRQTRQKDAIRDALNGCDEFISAQELHRKLEDRGEHIGLATVDRVRVDGQQLFRLCGDDVHENNVFCTGCGKTVEIESPSESWLKGISDKYGFTIERHTLEVFGLCEDCRKADK